MNKNTATTSTVAYNKHCVYKGERCTDVTWIMLGRLVLSFVICFWVLTVITSKSNINIRRGAPWTKIWSNRVLWLNLGQFKAKRFRNDWSMVHIKTANQNQDNLVIISTIRSVHSWTFMCGVCMFSTFQNGCLVLCLALQRISSFRTEWMNWTVEKEG